MLEERDSEQDHIIARSSLIFSLVSWPVKHSTHISANCSVRSEGAQKGEGLLQLAGAGGAVGKDIMIWDKALMLFASYTIQELELSVFPVPQNLCPHLYSHKT